MSVFSAQEFLENKIYMLRVQTPFFLKSFDFVYSGKTD